MRDSLDISRTRRRDSAGLKPILNCFLGEPRLAEVTRHQLRLRLEDLRKTRLNGGGDTRVDLLAARPEKAFVSCIAYECVLEDIGDSWRNAPAENQLCGDEAF